MDRLPATATLRAEVQKILEDNVVKEALDKYVYNQN